VAVLGATVLAQRRKLRWCNKLLRDPERILFGLGVLAFIFKRNIITILCPSS